MSIARRLQLSNCIPRRLLITARSPTHTKKSHYLNIHTYSQEISYIIPTARTKLCIVDWITTKSSRARYVKKFSKLLNCACARTLADAIYIYTHVCVSPQCKNSPPNLPAYNIPTRVIVNPVGRVIKYMPARRHEESERFRGSVYRILELSISEVCFTYERFRRKSRVSA